MTLKDEILSLAKNTIEEKIRHNKFYNYQPTNPALLKEAACFVTLKIDGQLRGCIGTLEPRYDALWEEVIHNAISAATEDPRFPPVGPGELDRLTYSVDVLKPAEAIESFDDLDANRYGVIVHSGMRRGVLLPNLEGVDSPQHQVSIALDKAGISTADDYKIKRFEVVRYEE